MKKKIAICFFGITRSLSRTISSIENNIITPASHHGETNIFAHFFNESEINNPRSKELGKLDVDEYKLLNANWLEIEPPNNCLHIRKFDILRSYGDEYKDDFRSLRNLLHQLHSLERVSKAAIDWGADIYIFARPDIFYHDSFKLVLERAVNVKRNTIFIPSWAHWGPGYNDRFSVCSGTAAAKVYGSRINEMVSFCESHGPLHSEKLVRYALRKSKSRVSLFAARGSRVRSDGRMVVENFTDFRILRLKEYALFPARLTERVRIALKLR